VSKTSRSGLDPSRKAVETSDPFDMLRLVSATQPRSARGRRQCQAALTVRRNRGRFALLSAHESSEIPRLDRETTLRHA